MAANPFGDYGDVDLSSVYYGSQAAQAAQTGQPVANPDGTNAPAGVDPNTGLALPVPPPRDPAADAAAAGINTTVQQWLVANNRPPDDGVTVQELIGILDQNQVDAAIQYGLFGPPGTPLGGHPGVPNSGYTKSTKAAPAGAAQGAPTPAAAPTPPDPANDYSQEIAALDKYIAAKAGKQGTATSTDGSVTVGGALAGDPQLQVYIDRRAEYATRQAQYDQQKAAYEAYRQTPAGMDPSANPVEGQRVLSTDPNARFTSTPTQNPDGTVSFAGYTMAGGSGEKSQYYKQSMGQSMINPNTIIASGGMGGNSPAVAQAYADKQTAKAGRQFARGLPADPTAAPPPPSNVPASNNGRPGRNLGGAPNRVTLPAMPANAPAPLAQVADKAQQMLGKVSLPGRPPGGGAGLGPDRGSRPVVPRTSRDFLKRVTEMFDDVEIRIKTPRRNDGATIQPVPNEE